MQSLQIINQLFEMQQKLAQENMNQKFERNFNRLFNIFEEEGYLIKNPEGEKYSDARTDCEINIVGREGKNMVITQVVKPVIYKQENGAVTLVQKGIVMVENK